MHFCYFSFLLFTPRYTEKASRVHQEETILNIQFVMLDCTTYCTLGAALQ